MENEKQTKLTAWQRLGYWWIGGNIVDVSQDAYSISIRSYNGVWPTLKRRVSAALRHPFYSAVLSGLAVAGLVGLFSLLIG